MHTHAQAHKKYILSQINQPELLPSNWLWSTFSNNLVSVFMHLILFFFFASCANSFLVFEVGQYVRLISGITFWRKGSAVANTIKWQSWIFQYFKNHIPILWTNIGMFWNYIIYFLNAWFVFACMGYDINLDAIFWFVLNYLLSIFWGNPNTLISEMV